MQACYSLPADSDRLHETRVMWKNKAKNIFIEVVQTRAIFDTLKISMFSKWDTNVKCHVA